ncbi:MAG: YigZ family protein [Flavobacteriales bacterium]|nr:YigZ family protein [Flavobacteriales bacterium]
MPEFSTYFTIPGRGEANYRVLGSRHLGYAIAVAEEEKIKRLLDDFRQQFHDATHVCYAWRLGWKKDRYRYSDDGEPSGTAGRPIYGQIQSLELTDVLVVVVRYFGGTKLGTGGLIDAYKTAARMALENAGRIELPILEELEIEFAYAAMSPVMRLIKSPGVEKLSIETGEICQARLRIPVDKFDEIRASFEKIQGTRIKKAPH